MWDERILDKKMQIGSEEIIHETAPFVYFSVAGEVVKGKRNTRQQLRRNKIFVENPKFIEEKKFEEALIRAGKVKKIRLWKETKVEVIKEIEQLLGNDFVFPPSLFHSLDLFGLKQLRNAIKNRINGYRR